MPGYKPRERYNARARQSAPGGFAHKKSKTKAKRNDDQDTSAFTSQPADANSLIHIPKTQQQKDQGKKERMMAELLAQSDNKFNAKKRKRLDKYIEKKLAQEERVKILEKLAKSQAQLPNSMRLASSATLGTGKVSSHEDRANQNEDREVRRAIASVSNGGGGRRKRRKGPMAAVVEVAADDSDSQDEDDDSSEEDDGPRSRGVRAGVEAAAKEEGFSKASPIDLRDNDDEEDNDDDASEIQQDSELAIYSKNSAPASVMSLDDIQVGSALKRNVDGSLPVPVKRSRGNKLTFSNWKFGTRQGRALHKISMQEDADAGADSSSSFDSSDSSNDSSSDDSEEEEGDDDDPNDAMDEDDELDSHGDEGKEDEETGEESEEEDEEDEEEDGLPQKPKRTLGFKDWALKQLSAAKGYVASPDAATTTTSIHGDPSLSTNDTSSPQLQLIKPKPKGPLPEMRGPLGEDLKLPATSLASQLMTAPSKDGDDNSVSGAQENGKKAKKGSAVVVNRSPEIQESRMLLPIVAEEQPIMEAVLLHPVVILCGETGSGKTTQVPQFLFEAGFGDPNSDNPGMIGITQPRRVAAISMAQRVAQELALPASRVSYQIRYDATVSPSTSIKFMTDGVLLRELATDFLLNKYSVIIVDEAHERSVNTDILIGVLSRVLKLREEEWKQGKLGAKPLRLIIMSATLRVSDFANNTTLFPTPPPVISVSARQHPVTVHFSRRTTADYVTESIKKAGKIHTRLPPGGILIFLTGQNEITGVCRRLESRFGKKAIEQRRKMRQSAAMHARLLNNAEEDNDVNEKKPTIIISQVDVEAEDLDLGGDQELALDVDDDAQIEVEDDPEALESEDEDARLNAELGIDLEECEEPMHIVPLYSLLPSDKQMKVFQPPPEGSRLVVISTNVAETSLTIPGIRYVIDCGRAKERRYDLSNGVQAYQITWTSKASAAQRAGRAGRTGPGHCYRLYSSALYENHFEQFSKPEILRMPIDGVVLQMKSMHIDTVMNFPFPTPPDRVALRQAETVLRHLGAIEYNKQEHPSQVVGNGQITELGRAMALFPLSPRYSRMLVSGRQHGCLPYVITIVAALSVGDPFLREEVIGAEESQESGDDDDDDEGDPKKKKNLTNAKEVKRAMRKAFFESQKLHSSLGKYTSDVFRMLSVVGAYEYAGGGHDFCSKQFVRPKAMEEIHKLRAQISNIVHMSFPETETEFAPKLKLPSDLQLKVLRQLLTAGFIDQVAARKDLVTKGVSSGTKYSTSRGVPYRVTGIPEDVFIHPSSVLHDASPPDYLVFSEVVRTSKIWIKGLTVVNPAWLSSLGKSSSMCTFSKPTKNSAGMLMAIPRFGPEGWELPPVKWEQK